MSLLKGRFCPHLPRNTLLVAVGNQVDNGDPRILTIR